MNWMRGKSRLRGAIRRDDANERADGNATAAQRAKINQLDPSMPTAGLSKGQAGQIIRWLESERKK